MARRLLRLVVRVVAAVALVAIAALGLTPTGRYLARAAWEEGRILLRRRPIAEVIADPRTDAPTRGKLQTVLAARAFAADSLGLPDDGSFTTYTELGRDTLVVVLSGARRDTLKAHTWWFPIVGRVPYKGFFHLADARRAADALRARGLAASLRTAGAFSTLGWFDDPLMSTMLRADSVDLVDTVIHELTHAAFYAPGQAVFNESYASFVGGRGAEAFFRARGDSAGAALAARQWDDARALGAFYTALGRELDSAYAAADAGSAAAGRGRDDAASVAARVAAADTVYARARATLVDRVAPRLTTVPRWWAQRVTLNNATLLARLVYSRELELFDAVFAREGRNLRRAVRTIERLAKGRPEDPYGAVREYVGRVSFQR